MTLLDIIHWLDVNIRISDLSDDELEILLNARQDIYYVANNLDMEGYYEH